MGPMKQKFLVNYEYGMGGVWALVMANSEEQISERFPELTVVHDRPAWLTEDEARRIEETLTMDIDDADAPVLKELIEARK